MHRENTFKIGMTRRSVEERMRELSHVPGVPTPFKAVHSMRVIDCVLAEDLLHEKLDSFRLNSNREFFDLPFSQAKLAVDSIANHINALADITLDLNTKPQYQAAANQSHWEGEASKWSKQQFEEKPRPEYTSNQIIHVNCSKCGASYKVTLSRYETGTTCISCGSHTAQDVKW